MKKIEKQAELERSKKIIDATLDYLLINDIGKLIFDGVDSDKENYGYQKTQADKYFHSNQLEKLENQLRGLTMSFMGKPSLDLEKHIKKNTGYDFDIFAEHRSGFEEVLAKGRIDTDKECNDFCIMISQEITDEKELVEKYGHLLGDFNQRRMAAIEASPELKKEYDEKHELVEEDGELIGIFYSHGKPSHHNRREVESPDKQRRLSITEHAYSDQSSTQIDLDFKNYGCSLYSVDGIHPEINAFWKDNQSIVIETKGYEPSHRKYRKLEIYGDIITVEYI